MKQLRRPDWARPVRSSGLLRVLALFAVIALSIGACGGGDDDDAGTTGSPPTSTVSSQPTAGTSPADAAGPTGAATGPTSATAPAGSGATGGVPDIADLTGLDSFRFEFRMEGEGAFLAGAGIPDLPSELGEVSGFSASGAWIAPDQAQVEMSLGGLQLRRTIKGDEEWSTALGVTTGPMPATGEASDLVLFSGFVNPEEIAAENRVECGGSETVNGVEAVRCEVPGDAAYEEMIAALAGQESVSVDNASFVIWVASEGNFVVRWELNASGAVSEQAFSWSLSSNITEINSVESIEP